MSEEIFRQKSLDRVKSPENLDEYIRVSNPGVWLVLVCVIILLAGACVWGIFGHIDSTVNTSVQISDGAAICYVSSDDITSVKEGMTVKFGDFEAAITKIGSAQQQGYACVLEMHQDAPNGYYDGRVVVGSVKPMSFVLN